MTTTLGEKAVGSIVKLKENDTPTEFIVVNQGKPSSGYDDSCNGTWVLRRSVHSKRAWNGGSTGKNYNQSSINTFLNGTYLSTIEEDIRTLIKSAKIPYINQLNEYPYGSTELMTCKVFLLSAAEVWPYSNYPGDPGHPGYWPGHYPYWGEEGYPLSYFYGAAGSDPETPYDGSKHIAYYHYSLSDWYLRTGGTDGSTESFACYVPTYIDKSFDYPGYIAEPGDATEIRGIRPAFVLPQDLLVDDDGNLFVNQPPTAPSSIDVANVTVNQQATITLGEATDPDGTVESYIYERKVDGGQWTQFANVNSLTQTDTVQSSWGTVAYRAKAVDDDGASGPYVEGTSNTVNTGWVIISGPALSMGDRPVPFYFDFSASVSGQSSTSDISVAVTLDGKSIYTGTVNNDVAVALYIDTRLLGVGTHTIQVQATKDTYTPAAKSYTFNVPAVTLPYEGKAEQPENAQGQPVWWHGLARFIIGRDGKDVQAQLDALEARIKALED